MAGRILVSKRANAKVLRFNIAALLSNLIIIAFTLVDCFDNVLYTDWFRENIHWFLPLIPSSLLVFAFRRRENKIFSIINIALIVVHYLICYWIFDFLFGIGQAGAAIFKML